MCIEEAVKAASLPQKLALQCDGCLTPLNRQQSRTSAILAYHVYLLEHNWLRHVVWYCVLTTAYVIKLYVCGAAYAGVRVRKISWRGAKQQAPKAPGPRRQRHRDRDAEGVEGGEVRIWCILMPSGGRWLQRFTKFCSVSSNAELRKLYKHRQHT